MNYAFSVLAGLAMTSGVFADSSSQPHPYVLDVSKGENRSVDAWLKAGGRNPAGEELGVNPLHWTRNGKPWTPAMGEFHFFRYPADLWEEEILKMKAGGITIVASYIYWEYAEKSQGSWNWAGDNDLRRFVELCGKHGLYVWLRIGPYINAEVQRGGVPEWAEKRGGKRSNADGYLELVRAYYGQVAKQVKGLYYKDGGPIIGCQLENEYAHGSKEHLVSLKDIAMKAGIDVPFYSCTSNSEYKYERGDVLPLQGAYPYRFWAPLVVTSDYLYNTDEWGAMDNLGRMYYDYSRYPRGMCELGGGCLNGDGHRFQVPAYDMEGSVQNVLGRGVNLVGYYMYHGGTNQEGWASGGNPKNYDYQAPLGEFGQIRPAYHSLKLLHMFMNDFGDVLGAMQPARPENMITDPKDVSRVRFAGRFKGDRGFLFMNTCQPWVNPHAVSDVQFEVKLPGETMKIPSAPMTVPENTSPVFPINLDMNGVTLRYSTARLLAKVDDNGVPCFVFCEEKGIKPEFQFAQGSDVETKAPSQQVGSAVCYYPQPSRNVAMTVAAPGGKKAAVLLLSRKDAEHAWRMDFAGKPRLLISDANVTTVSGKLELASPNASMELAVFPRLAASLLGREPQAEGAFSLYRFATPPVQVEVKQSALPSKSWTASVPSLPPNVKDILVQVDYTGSTVDLMAGKTKYTDSRHIGLPFEFSVKRFAKTGEKEVTVVANPWDGKVWGIPQQFAPASAEEEKGMIRSVKYVPEYVLEIPAPDNVR